MESPFSASVEDLAALSERDAEDLARRMIVAEADSAGVRLDQIRSGGRTSSPDRGVDFEVMDAPRESDGGLIKRGQTLYQVKSGAFTPSKDMRHILFKDSNDIKDPVRDCLEAGGTLVVILTKWGGSNTTRSGLEGKFAEELRGKVSCIDTPVRVWDPARIQSLLERYPSLALFVNSVPPEGIHTHDAWSRFDDMSRTFMPGDLENEFMHRLRELLLGDRVRHVRVTGEPGSGKTRLVLEATRDEKLRSKVVYADGPESIRTLLNHISIGGTRGRSNLIMIVDDCSLPEQANIWNKLKNSKDVRLVTIHSEEHDVLANTVQMPVPPLADAQLREILSVYVGTGVDLGVWIEYCKASPRAAHVVGANLRDNPDDMLRSPDTVAVWDRYIAGQNDPHGDEFKKRKKVLEWLSLFKTFGHGEIYGHELDRIAALVAKNANISHDDFMDTIRKLREMKVLQGTSMLYITPKLLHIYLWVEWWKSHSSSAAPHADDLVDRGEGANGSQNLLQWYLDMFRYARHSPEASKVVKGMLRQGGFLDSDQTLKSELGADFFLTLSSVDPMSSLACIDRIMGRIGADRTADFVYVHPNIPCALAQMLSRDDAFAGAMRHLLRFAVAAGGVDAAQDHTPNPSLDVYCNAFDPANAGISAPPSARLAVLKVASDSASVEDRRVAVRACGDTLAMHDHAIVLPRRVGFEHMPEPWVPKDRGEAAGYYLGIFNLLKTAAMDSTDSRLQREAAAAVVETMHQTVLVPELSQHVVALLKDFVTSGVATNARLLDQIALLLDMESDRIGTRAIEGLSSLRDSIEGSGFSAELRRHVGRYARHGWGTDLSSKRAADAIQELADKAVRDDALMAELDWLVTDEAVNGLDFGCEVGKRDTALRLLEPILNAVRRASSSATVIFLSGYLWGVTVKHPVDRESLLDRLLEDPALCTYVPEITWRTGMTKRAVERISRGVSNQRLGIESLQPLRYGHRMQDIPVETVTGLVAVLLEKCGRDEKAGATALDILHSYFVAGHKSNGSTPPLPDQLALDVLLHKGLVDPASGAQPDHVACSAWRELATTLARRDGSGALVLAKEMIDRFGDSALLHAPGPEPPSAVLAEIAVRRPREVWQMIAAYIVPPPDQRSLQLLEWIRYGGMSKTVGIESLAGALAPEIVAWVGEDPDSRAGRMSRHLPRVFSAIREFVVRFGDREDVRIGLASSLMTGIYRGSSVAYYADKKKWAQKMAESESDPNVLSFLHHYAEVLEMRIEREAAIDERLEAGFS